MDVEDALHIFFLSTLDLTALLTNAVYVFIIRQKTPKSLSSYATLLLNIACADLLASFCSLMCIYSLKSVSGRIVLVYMGPCTLVNAQLCHLFLAIHTNLVGQSVVLLVFSFAYRLWVIQITPNGQTPQHKQMWKAALLAIMILTLINTIIFYLGGSYTIPGFTSDHTYSAIDLSGGMADNVLPRTSLFSLVFVAQIGSVAVIDIRRRLLRRIERLSYADRHNHQQIYRSLMAQMALPLAYLPALALWLLDLTGVVHSRLLQRTILVASSLFALVSPMINMYYIPPYRRYLQRLLFERGQVATQMTSDIAFTSMAKF